MSQAIDTVNRYYAAWVAEGRGLSDLVTDDVKLQGPLAAWNGKAEFEAGARQMAPAVADIRTIKQVASGNDVMCVYAMDLRTPKGPVSIDVAEWLRTKGGKIAEAKLYYDARELAAAMAPA